MILSEEEIDLVLEKVLNNWWLDCKVTPQSSIAKAQLKKVYEWGDEDCYDHNGEQRKEQGWRVKRRECPLCWQALLEEVK